MKLCSALLVGRGFVVSENAVLQDALYSLGVTSCPPLTTDGSGRLGLHLRAPPMDGSGFGTVPD